MAINFAAESMQGYNNPKIEIINVEMNKNGTLRPPITFNDVAKILARGVFPILSVWNESPNDRMRHMLPLSYAQNDKILFSAIVMDGTTNSPSGVGFGMKFTPSNNPELLRLPLKGSI